ncbi:MAG: ABC transporter ATP-binding protein [Proteobacteria bacterium]|nr:ABC transporter ATP-binding protein [Pseudomonadota bacterium]MBI3498656.1 ABC transporter ATP-binding protein [Pseudomonadota bacterium]
MTAYEEASRGLAGQAELVRLERIGKVFSEGTVAVRDFSLAIGRNEFLSVLGPSGCGKSTVLRMIAGLGEPTSGTIVWPGAGTSGAAGPSHGLSFVFQEPTLMPWATVAGNVLLPLKIARLSRAEAEDRVAEALAMVGLEGFADRYPRQLSGGMKMRVSIARAVVTRPRVLLMDEPFAALDEITRFRLNDDLLALWQRQGWTVVFVTHSVYESVYLSSRIAVMTKRPGRIIADLDIEIPYPRAEGLRTSGTYNDYCRLVSQHLHDAMTAD